MAAEDYAIIIGLQHYPGLDDSQNGQPALKGPENDAREFYKWAISPNGGNVPNGSNGQESHVSLILSSDHLPPPGALDVFDTAKPAFVEVVRAFRSLRALSVANSKALKGPRVGRRLYVFMSGHGIAPRAFAGSKVKGEAALLLANVDPTNLGAPDYHIPGAYATNWFCDNECFDETMLFMDCCRFDQFVQLNTFFPGTGNADKSKRYFAFATRWSRPSRERPMADEGGNVRGVFTKTLLLGLSGKAAIPDDGHPGKGKITGDSLKSFLYQNMKTFMDPEVLLNNPDLQEPVVEYWSPQNNAGDILVIDGLDVEKFPAEITVPAGATGHVQVLYNGIDEVANLQVQAAPGAVTVDLPRGKYMAIVIVNGAIKKTVFDVKGIETANNKASAVFTA